ncbi:MULTISPECIES: hypothetical protein [unclassified Bartonella]|uniref:hypothetical protein n=1 Tax=unclassified Bartonella TaxID=2645622 RepID=UPI0035CF6696
MTIVLIILCILLLLPFTGIILEALCAIVGYGIGAAMIGVLIFLLIIGAKFLGFIYSLCLIIAFMALIAICNIKSNGNTWEEAISYSTALFLPLLILWFIIWYFSDNRDMLDISSVLFITAIICSIIAIPFTFNPPTKDIKGYPGFLIKMYCVILIFFAGLCWSKTTAIVTAIVSVIILIGYFIMIAYSDNDKPDEKDEKKASNENTS